MALEPLSSEDANLGSYARATANPMQGALGAALAEGWWMLVLRGVIAIGFGILTFISPGSVLLSLALLFGIYLIIDGGLGIAAAVRAAQADRRWWLLLVEALLSLAMGIIAIAFPAGAILAFVIVTAIWALMSGGVLLAAAFGLNLEHGRLWLAIGGLLSIAWGVLLIVMPLAGAVVLTWWLGAYALAFGIMMIAVGLKLRGQRVVASAPPRASLPG